MSEIPEVDPMAFTDEQPQADPTEAPKDEFFGDGIMSDNSPSDSSEGTGQPTEDSSPETAEIETEPTAPETKEEKAGRLRYEDYTRKSQERETQHQQRMRWPRESRSFYRNSRLSWTSKPKRRYSHRARTL
jgi:hypothetical protein